MRKQTRRQAFGAHTILLVLAAGFLLPLLGIVFAALHPSGESVRGLHWPQSFNWKNFSTAWTDGRLAQLFRSSLIIAGWVVPIAIILATSAGYGLALLRPVGARPIRAVFLVGLAIPIEVIVVPLYFLLQSFDLTDTYTGVILAEIALFMPFGTLWMMTNFESIPTELVESARIDGATSWRMLTRVLLPISWPSIGTLAALFFMWSWNQFLLVLILIQNPDKRTVPAGINRFVGEYTTNIPLLSSATLIAIGPVLIVYLVFQRTFVNGLLQGAIK